MTCLFFYLFAECDTVPTSFDDRPRTVAQDVDRVASARSEEPRDSRQSGPPGDSEPEASFRWMNTEAIASGREEGNSNVQGIEFVAILVIS